MVFDSSDEEDDNVYTNAAARLKVLKAMKHIPKPLPQNIVEEVPEENVIQEYDISETPIENDPSLTSQFSNGVSQSRTRSRAAAATRNNIENSPLITINLDSSMPLEANNTNDLESIVEIIDCDPDVPNAIDDDYMMDIKVRWRSREIERIKLGMNEKFEKIFQYFALLENISENQILLTRKDVPINHSDTPASVNLKIIDILEGGTVDTTFANNIDDTEPVCKIKVQSTSSTRHFLTYELGKNQPFKQLFEYCGKEKNVSPSKIKLSFDGERVSPSDTPDSLDLDDEACFDLHIVSN